tara:strand:- start:6901 stop:7566 length:666 start_codon:yes stop_codon:yes gene_type:complete
MSDVNKNNNIPSKKDKFNETGNKLRDIINAAIDNFKITYLPLKNNSVSKLEGGCYIKNEKTGNSAINMKKIDDNLHTEESCKLNSAIKQSNYLKTQSKQNQSIKNGSVYYSLVEREQQLTSKGFYDCYVSEPISENIEEYSDNLKEITTWKAFNENEKHLIKPGNYAYYRNGALFICDSGGNVLKQIGNTIDNNIYDNPQSYYILKDNEKECYASRYNDIP